MQNDFIQKYNVDALGPEWISTALQLWRLARFSESYWSPIVSIFIWFFRFACFAVPVFPRQILVDRRVFSTNDFDLYRM